MADLVAELGAIMTACATQGVEFALCGGLAVSIHGHVRATRDIDILVPAANKDDTLRALATVGFDLLALPMTFGERTSAERHVQRVSKSVAGTLVTVDVISVEPAFEEVWAGREVFEQDGQKLVVVSRRGLIEMKRLRGRPQDLADIAALEGHEE